MVRLLPGAAEALKRLRRAGFARVLVTNQSAIGRGMLTEERLDQIHAEMNRQLAASGATLDAHLLLPGRPGRRRPDRGGKPRPQAGPRHAAPRGGRSEAGPGGFWMVGDLISDVLAGLNAGCRSILVESGQTAHRKRPDALAGRFLIAARPRRPRPT